MGERKPAPGTKNYHEVLVLQRKDNKKIEIHHNEAMMLDKDDPAGAAFSQIDWDGLIWPRHVVRAAFIFRPQDDYFAVVIPSALNKQVPVGATFVNNQFAPYEELDS